jgi:hypothetical protein
MIRHLIIAAALAGMAGAAAAEGADYAYQEGSSSYDYGYVGYPQSRGHYGDWWNWGRAPTYARGRAGYAYGGYEAGSYGYDRRAPAYGDGYRDRERERSTRPSRYRRDGRCGCSDYDDDYD